MSTRTVVNETTGTWDCPRCGSSWSTYCAECLCDALMVPFQGDLAMIPVLQVFAAAPNAVHPDPGLNPAVAREATEAAAFDLAAGIEPGWHRGDPGGEIARLEALVTQLRAEAASQVERGVRAGLEGARQALFDAVFRGSATPVDALAALNVGLAAIRDLDPVALALREQ